MPRMSKKRRIEWSLYLNDCNRITYNELCRKCCHDCKQSFRSEAIQCQRYLSKRSVRAERQAVQTVAKTAMQ